MKTLILALFFLVHSGQVLAWPPVFGLCRDSDKDCLTELMDRSPSKSKSHWRELARKPLADRIRMADNQDIELLRLLNRFYEDSVRAVPGSAEKIDDFLIDVRQAMIELPEQIKGQVKAKVFGIILAENTGSTAATIDLLVPGESPDSAIIVLDIGALYDKTANQWATWKENSPFDQSGSYKIKMTIAEPSYNNRVQAIQYILLHEIGHVLALNSQIHPLWFSEKKLKPVIDDFPFLKLSWKFSSNKYQSIYDDDFPSRPDIRYYFGKDLPNTQIPEIYKKLLNTSFVTLYGATSPYDDWAEAFVTYVHTRLMKKIFRLEVLSGDKVVQEIPVCWDTSRCRSKEIIVRRFLGLEQDPG